MFTIHLWSCDLLQKLQLWSSILFETENDQYFDAITFGVSSPTRRLFRCFLTICVAYEFSPSRVTLKIMRSASSTSSTKQREAFQVPKKCFTVTWFVDYASKQAWLFFRLHWYLLSFRHSDSLVTQDCTWFTYLSDAQGYTGLLLFWVNMMSSHNPDDFTQKLNVSPNTHNTTKTRTPGQIFGTAFIHITVEFSRCF